MQDNQPAFASAKRFVESDRVEGTVVYDLAGHRVGTVKRLIIERVSGQIKFVIITFETYFGICEGDHALSWSKLYYDEELDGYRTDVVEDELREAPYFLVRSEYDHQDPGFQAYYRIPPSGRAI